MWVGEFCFLMTVSMRCDVTHCSYRRRRELCVLLSVYNMLPPKDISHSPPASFGHELSPTSDCALFVVEFTEFCLMMDGDRVLLVLSGTTTASN